MSEEPVDRCADCGFEMKPLDFLTDKLHQSCHRCCSKECMNHYFTIYGQGWMVEF